MDYRTIEEYLRRLGAAGAVWLFHVNSDQPAVNTDGRVEVAASRFPIPAGYRLIYRLPYGSEKRYQEYLYLSIERLLDRVARGRRPALFDAGSGGPR